MIAVLALLSLAVVTPQDRGRAAKSRCPSTGLGEDASGPRVSMLQKELRRKGFLPGAVDGHFGAATEDAVEAFQRQSGIRATGVVNRSTWRALFGRRC